MDKPLHPIIRAAIAIASRNAYAFLAERGMTRGSLGAAAQKAGSFSRKTAYNVLDQKKPPKIETLAKMAEFLGCPVWALLLDGLHEHPELLKPGALRGLSSVIEGYLASTPERRTDIEDTARVAARLSTIDK